VGPLGVAARPAPGLIAGVVLAAGQGSRFGSAKQLARLDGRPLLEHALAAMAAAPVDVRLLVLGARAPEIRVGVDLWGHDVVIAGDWAQGMSASLRAGVGAAAALGAQAVVITLGDQPGVGAGAIARVVGARGGGAAAVRASYGGEPSHPVLFERELFAELREVGGDRGAREILMRVEVRLVGCDDVGAAGDVDVPADLGTPGPCGRGCESL
jgi:molybdenum cofactor cytidylyltransferase